MTWYVSILAFALCSAFGQALPQESSPQSEPSSLQVDLGYASYQGFQDGGTGLNAWLGISYAAPPTGDLRWRAPQAPAANLSGVIQANNFAPYCPQTPSAPRDEYPYQGNEDCLYLNVYAPEGATELPVLFHIHGGGYGGGTGQQNFTQLSKINSYGFVIVSIQYRLGGLGFLAGDAVHNDGDLNVGLLDQHFALEWVQEHIHKFGGNARNVTIEGVSSAGGSVMLLSMAYGGTESTRLFRNGIASSPYVPAMYHYSDPFPQQNFMKLAELAGCYSTNETAVGKAMLDCLRKVDTDALQYASFKVGSGGNYGSWAFVPVVDDDFAQDLPSTQLSNGSVNGVKMLTSHNSNDGAQFVSQNTTDFVTWLRTGYPLLTEADISTIDSVYYPSRSESIKFATCGDCGGPTMVNVGPFATGDLQRAMAFYSEATFICPSYFLASAFQAPEQSSYKYQISVVPGYHGMDLLAESLIDYPNALAANIGPDFHLALTTVWGNMIRTGDPSIALSLADGDSTDSLTTKSDSRWPPFTSQGNSSWKMVDLNQTGGVEYETVTPVASLPPVKQYMEPDLQNSFRAVDAYTWEDGQGKRCEFLRNTGERIPF